MTPRAVTLDEHGHPVIDISVSDPRALQELIAWLTHVHERTLEDAGSKAVEYGSKDLTFMGNALQSVMSLPEGNRIPPEVMACWFYIVGKLSRLSGAIERGEPPSADTWYDIHVYALMALKIQETGTWL